MPVLHNLLGRSSPSTANGRVRSYLANEALGARQSTIHENVVNPGGNVPWHGHAIEEIIVVLEGFGECRTAAGVELYRAGDVIILPAGQRHALHNVGSIPLRQLCFFPGPPATKWLNDETEPGQTIETFNPRG